MNRSEIEYKFLKFSLPIDLLYIISSNLAYIYTSKFSDKTINKLLKNTIDTKNETKLSNRILKSYFNKKDIELFFVEDNIKLYLNESLEQNEYILIDLNDYVIEYVKNGQKQILIEKQKYPEFLINHKNDILKIEESLKAAQEKLYLKSLILNYTYLVLKDQAKNEVDLTRLGMFKNAYFDILKFCQKVDEEERKRGNSR